MVGVIILGGPMFEMPDEYPMNQHCFVVCADGGIKKARNWGITPNVIVGDFDSSNLLEDEREHITIRQFPKEKDYTDGEIAIRCILEQQVDQVLIFGKFAGRFDHVLSGVMLMKKIASKSIPVTMLDGQNSVIYHLPGSIKLPKKNKQYFSVLPLDSRLEGVSIVGAKYPLNNVVLKREETWGISNEWKEDVVTITTQNGDALIVINED